MPNVIRPAHVGEIDGHLVGVVPLTRGEQSLVNVSDLGLVCDRNWFVVNDDHRRYAATTVDGLKVGMHRILMDPPAGHVVDHIDSDGLNNRRSNLRVVTGHQNTMNQRGNRGTSSRFKGVTHRKKKRAWVAQIQVNGKNQYLGFFRDEIEAAKAYDEAARDAFGSYALLNFPDE